MSKVLNGRTIAQDLSIILGNERLQEMMGIMAQERGGKIYATDER